MDSAEQILEREMEKATLFFKAGRSGKKEGQPCFFKLGHKKTVDSVDKVGRSAFYRSFEHTEVEDALVDLERAIRLHGSTSMAYISVSLVASGRSNNDYVTTLQNPYYQGTANNSISGFGGNMNAMQNPMFQMQQTQQSMMMQLQAQMHQQQLESERHIRELEHKQDLKDKQDYIEALEDSKKSNIAKIGELAESQAGVVLVNYLIGFMNNLKPAPPSIQGSQVQTPPQEQPAQQQSDQQYTQEQIDASVRMQNSIEKINTVFEDPISALEAVANYIKNNPEVAKNLLATQKTQ